MNALLCKHEAFFLFWVVFCLLLGVGLGFFLGGGYSTLGLDKLLDVVEFMIND